MDYEKIHNDSLEMAKQLLEEGKISKESVERMFPELRESKDEKTKRILHSISSKMSLHLSDIFTEEEFQCFDAWSNVWFKREDEQKPMPIFKVGETIIAKDGTNIIKEPFHIDKIEDDYYWDGENTILVCNQDEFELVEQKHADKVEPKFKVGDWVVRGKTIAQILDIQEQYYVGLDIDGNDFTSSRFLSDDKIHLWTIQDAKDGDVLAAHECYVIFKEIDGLNIKCYCTYHYLGFNPIFYVDTLQNKEAFQPATKEQRDALMKAMSDAGYTFNFEKKEFKKIEQKQEWTGNDERLFISALWHIENSVSNGGKNSGQFEIYNWLKSLKERVQLLKQWKPSDEQIMALKWALNRVPYYSYTEELHGLLEQLKKLREE